MTIVKGDDFARTVKVYDDDKVVTSSSISHLYFSSSSLNITKELTYNSTSKDYSLELTKSQTNSFAVGTHSFDITMDSSASKRSTIIYEGAITVVAKNNTVSTNSDEDDDDE